MILTILRTLGYILFAFLMKRMVNKATQVSSLWDSFTPMTVDEYVKRHGHKRPF